MITEEELLKLAEKKDWHWIVNHFEVPEHLIEKYHKELTWDNISSTQKLSEEFIEKHSKEVNWHFLSSNQNLSEPFIEKHAEQLSWFLISKFQRLSLSFIRKHKSNLKLELVIDNQLYFLEKIIQKIKLLDKKSYEYLTFNHKKAKAEDYYLPNDYDPTNEMTNIVNTLIGISKLCIENSNVINKETNYA
jgi:hypothetical protein